MQLKFENVPKCISTLHNKRSNYFSPCFLLTSLMTESSCYSLRMLHPILDGYFLLCHPPGMRLYHFTYSGKIKFSLLPVTWSIFKWTILSSFRLTVYVNKLSISPNFISCKYDDEVILVVLVILKLFLVICSTTWINSPSGLSFIPYQRMPTNVLMSPSIFIVTTGIHLSSLIPQS